MNKDDSLTRVPYSLASWEGLLLLGALPLCGLGTHFSYHPPALGWEDCYEIQCGEGDREMWHLLSGAWGLVWSDSLRSKPTDTWEEHCDGIICAIANPEHCV